MDESSPDDGVQGARLALRDDATTGRFVDQEYRLEEVVAADADAFRNSVAADGRLFVSDLPASLLLAIADLPEVRDVTILDSGTADDRLRGKSSGFSPQPGWYGSIGITLPAPPVNDTNNATGGQGVDLG